MVYGTVRNKTEIRCMCEWTYCEWAVGQNMRMNKWTKDSFAHRPHQNQIYMITLWGDAL